MGQVPKIGVGQVRDLSHFSGNLWKSGIFNTFWKFWKSGTGRKMATELIGSPPCPPVGEAPTGLEHVVEIVVVGHFCKSNEVVYESVRTYVVQFARHTFSFFVSGPDASTYGKFSDFSI